MDRIGNDEADAAADLGRRRVHHAVIYAWGMVNRSCARWYPVVQELHRFFIAITRSVLNDDGVSGTTLHPVVWSAAANPKRRKAEQLLIGTSCQLLALVRVMLVLGLFSVGLLLKFAHFLCSLHWPCGAGDPGIGGVSYFELLILYERWASERLVVEGAVPFARRVGRPISVSAVPVGPGINIGHSCRFLGSNVRLLALLPGGLSRFLPCRIGANHCRIRHLGWEKCGHGLTFRPRETSDPVFLDFLLEVFGYPVKSGSLLLAGGSSGVGLVEFPVVGDQVGFGCCWTRGAGGAWKRMRLTEKNGQFVSPQTWCSPCPSW